MSDARPLASLSSSLLARKGSAKPAMRPQAIVLGETYGQNLEDLGWNDMGEDVFPASAAEVIAFPTAFPEALVAEQPTAPVERVVEEQREHIAREFTPNPVVVAPVTGAAEAPRPRALAGSKGRAAFTLRLDADRHLKLRLVCAVAHRSAQHVVTQALDEFLARQPEVGDLTAKLRN